MSQIIIRNPDVTEYAAWSKIYQMYLEFYQKSLTEDELERVWSWIFTVKSWIMY